MTEPGLDRRRSLGGAAVLSAVDLGARAGAYGDTLLGTTNWSAADARFAEATA